MAETIVNDATSEQLDALTNLLLEVKKSSRFSLFKLCHEECKAARCDAIDLLKRVKNGNGSECDSSEIGRDSTINF